MLYQGYWLQECRVTHQQVPLVHCQLHHQGEHHLPGQAGLQQEEGVQLDRGLQLENSLHSVNYFGRVWGGQILPRTLAGGHWETIQLWRSWGLDIGGCSAGINRVYWTC